MTSVYKDPEVVRVANMKIDAAAHKEGFAERLGSLPTDLGRAVALSGLVVAIVMALMKLVPAVPGHFTIYEWIALGAWIMLGVISYRKTTH